MTPLAGARSRPPSLFGGFSPPAARQAPSVFSGIRYCAIRRKPATSCARSALPLATKGTQEVAIKTRQGYDAQAYLNERATSRSGCIPPLREGLGWVMLSFSSFLLRRKKRTEWGSGGIPHWHLPGTCPSDRIS